MKMRRGVAALCIGAMLIGMLPNPLLIQAYDFSDEEAWINKCSGVQESSQDSAACNAFKEYYKEQQEALKDQINSFKEDIDNLQSDLEDLETLVAKQKKLIEEVNASIEEKNNAIAEIQANIAQLEEDIAAKEEEIEKWDAQIKERMIGEQASIGTNMYIDMIMGAKDLQEMMRTMEGLQRIMESDEEQINMLKEEKEALDQKRNEQKRLEQDAIDQKEALEAEKQQAEELKESSEQMITLYHQQEAELQEQMRSAQVDLSTVSSNLVNLDNIGDYTPSSSDGWLNPVSGPTSAGTWYYPGGGVHLGVDRAVSIGTPIYAPADGLVVWVANPVGSNSGYLGNWSGYPAGAGNNIAMLVNVGGTTYFVSFSHMSQNGMAVYAGQSVSQGQLLGLTGNAGNSSGPHCHIEIINLGSMSITDAASQFSRTADFAWGCGWSSPATGCDSKGSTPCRERPETLIG